MKPFELHIMDVAPLAETETQSDHEIWWWFDDY